MSACSLRRLHWGLGGGYSRSTYDEYGRSVNGAGNVVDDCILLRCTMVDHGHGLEKDFFIVDAKCTSFHPDLWG